MISMTSGCFSEIKKKHPFDTISKKQDFSLWKVEAYDTRKRWIGMPGKLSVTVMYKIDLSSLSISEINEVCKVAPGTLPTKGLMSSASSSVSVAVRKDGINRAAQEAIPVPRSGLEKVTGPDQTKIVNLSTALSKGYVRLNELPVNFIWIGSMIPTRYLENIGRWSEQYPERLFVLWVNSDVISSAEIATMIKLMNKNNIRVLDIAKSKLMHDTPILCDVGKWLFADINDVNDKEKIFHYVAASDIYRIALMYFGSEIITQMLTETDAFKEKLVNTGMIYFDTDIHFESVKGIKDCLFKGVLEFEDGNDIFAASQSKVPFFDDLQNVVLEDIQNKMKQKSINIFKSIGSVTDCSFHKSERMKSKKFGSSLNYAQFPFENPVRCADGTWQYGEAIDMKRPVIIYETKVP